MSVLATRVCDWTFNKNGNQTVNGTGATYSFDQITLNLGASMSNILEVKSVITMLAATASPTLTLNNGTFKLSSASTLTPFGGNITIPATAGYFLNAAGTSNWGNTGNLVLEGGLTVVLGTMNVASSTSNALKIGATGTFSMSGGAVNVKGRVEADSTGGMLTISGGVLTIPAGGTVNTSANSIFQVSGTTFNMSNGTISVNSPNTNTTLADVNINPSSGSITGGLLQITTGAVANTISVSSTIPVFNFTIVNGAAAVVALLRDNPLVVSGALTITSGTLDAATNNINIQVNGNWTNSGTYNTGTNTVTFHGTVAQTIGGTATSTFNNLTAANSVSVTLAHAITANGNLAVNTGTFIDAGFQITGNAAGTMTMAAGTGLTLGTAATATAFPTNFVNGNITLNATSTVTYNSNAAQTISGVPTYGNLTLAATAAATKTLGAATTIAGVLTIGANNTLDVSASNFAVNIAGNWTNNSAAAAFTARAGTVTFNGAAAQTLGGTQSTSFNNLTIANSVSVTLARATTVNGNLAVNTGTLIDGGFQIAGNAAGTMTMAAGTGLTLGTAATATVFPTLFTNANITLNTTSTVTYNSNAAQTISGVPAYGNLTLAATAAATKTLGAATAVNGNLTIGANNTLADGGFQITGNGTGTMTTAAGTGLTLGTAATATAFPTNFVNANIALNATSTVTYNSNAAQTISGVPAYGNLTLAATAAVTKTLGSAVTINGALTLNNLNTLDVSASNYGITLGGNWNAVTGSVFTARSGVVTFNGTGAQQILGTLVTKTYNNVVINMTPGMLLNTAGGTTTVNVTNLTMTQGNFTPPATLGITGSLTLTAGTLTAGTNINVSGNWTNNGGTFTPGANTVTFNSAAVAESINGTAATQTFNNLIVNKTGQTLAIGGSTTTLTMNGAFTLTAGTFTAPATLNVAGALTLTAGTLTAGAAINVGGNWSAATGTVFTPGTGAVTFNGSGAQQILGTLVTETYNDVVINKSVGTLLNVAGSTTTVNVNNLTMTQGNFTPPATLSIAASLTGTTGTFTAGTNINVSGNWTNNGVTFTPGANTVTFNSTTAAQAIKGSAVTQTFNNLVVNKTGQTLTVGGSTTTLAINAALTITAGTLAAGTATALNIAGNWSNNSGATAFTAASSTVTFNGVAAQTLGGTQSTSFNNLTIANSVSVTLARATTVNGNLAVNTGTFIDAGFQLTGNASGTMTMAAGTGLTVGTAATATVFPTLFTNANISLNATSTVTYNSNVAQTISGVPAYGNVTLAATAAVTKTLGAATTINHNLAINANNTLADGGFQITGNAAGTMTMAAGTGLTLGTAATATAFPTNFVNGNITLNATSTVTYNSNAAQTISGVPTYGNLTLAATAAATKTLGAATTIAGVLTIGANNTLDVSASNFAVNIAGNWTNNSAAAAFTARAGTVTFNGAAAQTLGGTQSTSFNNLTIANSVSVTLARATTVNGNLAVNTGTLIDGGFQIAGNAAGTMTMAAGTGLTLGTAATATVFPTLFTNANITLNTTSTVTYNSNAAQTISGVPAYGNLTLAATAAATKTLGAATAVNGNLTIGANNTLADGGFQITGNGTGTMTTAAGTGLTLGTAATATAFPTNFVNANIALNATSTVTYNSNAAQTISGVPAYGNLTLAATAAVTKTLGSAVTINGALTLNNLNTLDVSASNYGITLGGNWNAVTGSVFTARSGVVTFNGTGAQQILGTLVTKTYNNVVINMTPGMLLNTAGGTTTVNVTNLTMTQGNFTPPATLGITGSLTLTAGTLTAGTNINVSGNWTNNGGTFTPGANTVTFNSAAVAESINGTAATQTFNNLIVNKTGQTLAIGGSTTTLTMNGAFTLTAGTFTAPATLNVAGALTLTAGTLTAGAAINVGGNWTNNAGAAAFTASSGTVTLNGGSAQSIGGSFPSTFYNLTVNNSNGVSMAANVTAGNALTISAGSLSTGAQTVTLASSATISESPGATVFGNLTITKNIIATSGTEYLGNIGTDITMHGTAPGNTTVLRKTGTASTGNGHNSILRYFNISPTTNSGLNADLVFHYDNSELNGQTASILELYKSTDNGSTWSDIGGTVNTGAGTISVSGLDGFSRWTASDTNNSLGTSPTPTTTSINPTSKTVGDPGFTLTVNGTNFVNGKSTVQLGGSSRSTSFVNQNQLTATIPAGDLVAAGTRTITVFNSNGGGSSNGQTLTVNQAGTIGNISSNLNPSVFGQSVTFTATATPATGSGVNPTGHFTFYDGASLLGTVSLVGDSAQLSTGTLVSGSHTVKAVYGGDANFQSDSATIVQVVNQATPILVLSSNLNPSSFEQNVTFKVIMTNLGGTPTGSVTFYDGAGSLGTVSWVSDSASLSTANLSVGGHTIKVVYPGDVNYVPDSTTLAQTVNMSVPTMTLTSSANPSTFEQNVTFKVHVDGVSHTPTGSVTFYDGASSLGTASLTGDSASVATAGLSVGGHTIKAVYGGDGNFVLDSMTLAQTVNKSLPSMTLLSSVNPSTFAQNVTFQVHVDGVSHTPTGSVTFYDGAGLLGTITLVGDSAQMSTAALTGGSHLIKGVYGGDGNFKSDSMTIVQTVNQASPLLVLSSSFNPSSFEQNVTFKVHVSNSGPTPTGSVTFYDGASSLGTVPWVADSASVSTANLTSGVHAIKVVYLGDINFVPDSTTLVQTVNKSLPTMSLSSSVNPSTFEQNVTFKVHVDGVSHTPTGSVTFYDGAILLGTTSLVGDSAFVSTANLSGGSHTIKTVYGGDGNFAIDSTTAVQTVNKSLPTMTLLSSVNPSTFEQNVTFKVHVDGVSHTPTGSVTFYNGASSLGATSLVGDSALLSTANLSGGSHTIKTVYGGDGNFVVDSTTVIQTVNKELPTMTLLSSVNPSTFEQNVIFKVHVDGVSYTPTGSVTFYDGATSLGTASLIGDSASVATAGLSVGGHTVKVVYGDDGNFVSDSTTLVQTVNKSVPTLTLSSSANPSTFEQSVTFKIHVTNSSHTPTGSVTFYDGVSALGTASLVGDSALVSTPNLTGGGHTVKAVYGGDGNFVSDSTTLTQTVNPAIPSLALTLSANPSTFEQNVTFKVHVDGVSHTPTGSVTFYDGVSSLGTIALAGDSALLSTTNLSGGSHTIKAVYGGDGNFVVDSTTVVQTVNKSMPTMTLLSSVNPSTFEQNVTFKVHVDGVSHTPTGSVTFYNGASSLGTTSLVGDSALLSTANLSGGSHTIKTVYGGDGNFVVDSTTVIQTVNKELPMMTLLSSVNPSTFEQNVTFKVHVDGVSHTPTGSVTFYDGGTSLGTASLVGDSASVSTSNLTAGGHTVKVVYGDDGNFVSDSTTLAQTVNKAPPGLVLTSSVNPSTYLQNVIFKMYVSNSSYTPTGSVTFYNGAISLGVAALVGDSTQVSTSSLMGGSRTIKGVYGGDGNFRSDSATLLQTVKKKPTVSFLTYSAGTSFYRQPVTFSDSVAGSVPDGGKVLFEVDGIAFGDSAAINGSGVAIVTIANMDAGTHSVQGFYGGTNEFDTSRSNTLAEIVTRVATTGILSSALNPSIYGQAVVLRDSVTGSPDSGTVQFKEGNNNLGSPDSINANGVAVLSVSSLNAGSHNITAIYSGTTSLSTNTSNVLIQIVRKKPTSSVLTSSLNPLIFGQPVIFRDSITGSPVGGSVVFKDGNLSLGAAVSIDSTCVATVIAPGLLRGPHFVQALYSGTSNFTGSVSDTLAQMVNPRPTSSVLVQSSSTSLLGDTVTFVDSITSLRVPDGGAVQFKDGGLNLGNPVSIDTNGIVRMSTSALPAGSHTITADYGGTNNYTPCSSNAIVHAIADSARFRSISAINLTNQRDNLGKSDKYVQRKADRVYFSARMVNDTISTTGLYIEFSIGIDTGHPLIIVPTPVTATASDRGMQKWFVAFADSVRHGDTVKVYGWGVRNKLQAIARYYWRRGTARSSRDKKDAQFSVNTLQLPMPNNLNVLYEAYAYGGFAPTNGMVVGRNRSDSARYFGWVRLKNYSNALKSLKDRSGVHSCIPRPFDFYTSGCSLQLNRPITREQSTLPPSKQNNTLFADMIALKLNVVASALNITPVGFGELVFDDGMSTSLDGMTVGEISAYGDSLMSGFLVDSTYLRAGKPTTVKVRHFANADAFLALDSVIAKVNSAFEGPMDTVKFSDTLRLTGVKRLGDVSYLHRDPHLLPARIVPVLGNDAYASGLPAAYQLYQNYPNPFNPATTIRFDLPQQAVVTLKIYNILGQEVTTLYDRQQMDVGTQEVQFDASRLASGVYIYRMIADGMNDDGTKAATFMTVKKMLMIK